MEIVQAGTDEVTKLHDVGERRSLSGRDLLLWVATLLAFRWPHSQDERSLDPSTRRGQPSLLAPSRAWCSELRSGWLSVGSASMLGGSWRPEEVSQSASVSPSRSSATATRSVTCGETI
jgi:hypothetical protein